MSEQVGLIGLGLVGKALVKRLTAAGHSVLGYDLSPDARESAQGLGASVAGNAQTLASAGGILFLSLPDSDVVREVLWADGGMAQFLPTGAFVVDTTTGRPRDAIQNAERLEKQGVRFADCTLSGSSEDIAAGRATAMIGDLKWFEDSDREPPYVPAVQAFAESVFCMGPAGSGCLAKLIVNLVMGLNRAALAEALALGMNCGMSGASLLSLLASSAAYSRVLDMKGQRMVEGDYAPASRIAQHAKDVRLILEEAECAGMDLPLERAHQQLLEGLIARGLGDLDNAALIEAYRRG